MLEFIKNIVVIITLVVVLYICGLNFFRVLEAFLLTFMFYKIIKTTFNRIKINSQKTN